MRPVRGSIVPMVVAVLTCFAAGCGNQYNDAAPTAATSVGAAAAASGGVSLEARQGSSRAIRATNVSGTLTLNVSGKVLSSGGSGTFEQLTGSFVGDNLGDDRVMCAWFTPEATATFRRTGTGGVRQFTLNYEMIEFYDSTVCGPKGPDPDTDPVFSIKGGGTGTLAGFFIEHINKAVNPFSGARGLLLPAVQ